MNFRFLPWVPVAISAASLASGAPGEATRPLDVRLVDSGAAYTIGLPGSAGPALRSGFGVRVDGRWIRSADYPRRDVERSAGTSELGAATDWRVVASGLAGAPDLILQLRAYSEAPFGEIQVTVRNTTGRPIGVESIRSVDAAKSPVLDLGGPPTEDRVLSDSCSEGRPPIRVLELADTGRDRGMHRGVGSQLVYNRSSRESLFLGALTARRFFTILRLQIAPAGGSQAPAAYEVDATGTTEMARRYPTKDLAQENLIELKLPVEAGESLSSERMLFGLGSDYHRQLETYGALIRRIDHARVFAPPLLGWWSWTAFYFGLNEGAAAATAEWEAAHLRRFGYNVFHIDEGYQYARGEYTTPNADLFPHGMRPVYYRVHGLGLVPAIWTAPFQVSVRAWVYQHHPEWLVKNAAGQPLLAAYVLPHKEPLYVLDATHPAAQAYLRHTYSVMVKEWGIRYIKLDFMDDCAVEGYYFRPHTTALEAQRIGLTVIRQAVGDDVYLDKDGSPMLTPVGLVDYGRISQDTSHAFASTKVAATGIAARYYMNRNFFVSDPDAFNVSSQRTPDFENPTRFGSPAATLSEAEASIALACVSGGMLEIGDDLPLLGKEPERLALVENPELLAMVRLGQASRPVDLMDFAPEDGQPSIFFLREDGRQSILTVFNFTDRPRSHRIPMARLGLDPSRLCTATDVIHMERQPDLSAGGITFSQPPHSVRVLRIVDTAVPVIAPVVAVEKPAEDIAGQPVRLSAQSEGDEPVLDWQWDFGDGVREEGAAADHAYIHAGDYEVTLTAVGVGGGRAEKRFTIRITGQMSPLFVPDKIRRGQSE